MADLSALVGIQFKEDRRWQNGGRRERSPRLVSMRPQMLAINLQFEGVVVLEAETVAVGR